MSKAGISTEVQFDAGHRLPNHEGKCSNPHGHRYRVVVYVTGYLQSEGSSQGMVMDFQEIKPFLKEIHDKFDHGFIYYRGDTEVSAMVQIAPHRKWVKVDFMPTAEELALYCFEYLEERMEDTNASGSVSLVEVWETPTSCAVYPSR